jgi:hypothetical protein
VCLFLDIRDKNDLLLQFCRFFGFFFIFFYFFLLLLFFIIITSCILKTSDQPFLSHTWFYRLDIKHLRKQTQPYFLTFNYDMNYEMNVIEAFSLHMPMLYIFIEVLAMETEEMECYQC